MKVKFTGGKELEAALMQLDISAPRKRVIARRALDRAAEPIHAEWVRNVDVVKGDLRRSIKIGNRAQTKRTRKFKRTNGEDIIERFIGIDESEAPPGRLVVYAPIEEFGASDQPANPAGRNAWESKKMESFNRLAGDLKAEIEKTAARAARKAAKG